MEKLRITGIVPVVEKIAAAETPETKVSQRRSHFNIRPSKQNLDRNTNPTFNPATIRRKIWHGIFKAGR